MIRWLLINVVLLTIYPSAFSQADHYTLAKRIPGDYVDFSIDNLGNIYAINSGNQLKKLSTSGDSLAVYNDIRRFGKLYSIDASNPLRIVLFYRDFGSVVILDRFLNIRNTINLRALNIFQVRAVCQSYDNGIWLYDEQEARLKKVSEDAVLSSQTSDFRTFLDVIPFPNSVADQDKLVYLYDPEKGLFIFDYFGTLRNKVPLTSWRDFQVLDGKTYGRKDNKILQYAPGSLDLKEEAVPQIVAGIDRLWISRDYLYCLKKGTIEIYRISH